MYKKKIPNRDIDGIEHKFCRKCSTWKEFENDFQKNQTLCKSCRKQYKIDNKESILEKDKKYYQENKDRLYKRKREYIKKDEKRWKQYHKDYKEKNRDILKEKEKKYYEENKEAFKQRAREYSLNNPDKAKENFKNRYYNDPNYKVRHNLRSRLSSALKRVNGKKSDSTFKLLGCDVDFFINYIEEQFKEGMSWDNHGMGNDKWHLDHILPCASFDLTKEEEQKKCFHYSNIQPLWQIDNLKKGARIL